MSSPNSIHWNKALERTRHRLQKLYSIVSCAGCPAWSARAKESTEAGAAKYGFVCILQVLHSVPLHIIHIHLNYIYGNIFIYIHYYWNPAQSQAGSERQRDIIQIYLEVHFRGSIVSEILQQISDGDLAFSLCEWMVVPPSSSTARSSSIVLGRFNSLSVASMFCNWGTRGH